MQGVDAGLVQHPGHLSPHGADIQRRVPAAGRIAFVIHRVGPKLVAFRGVGVHDQHLRRGAVPLNRKRQAGGRDGGAQVRVRTLGAVFDAACGKLQIAGAAALPQLHRTDAARVRQLGCGAGQRRGRGGCGRLRRCGRCRGRARRGQRRGAAFRPLRAADALCRGGGPVKRRRSRRVLQIERPRSSQARPGQNASAAPTASTPAAKAPPYTAAEAHRRSLCMAHTPSAPKFYALFLLSMKFFSKTTCNFAKSMIG